MIYMIAELIELNEKASEEASEYPRRRFIYDRLENLWEDPSFIGLIGPRGVGKTVLLKQFLAAKKAAFYLSLDSVRLTDGLYPTAKELQERGIRYLLVDEIHSLPDFKKDLKKIRDFLKLKIIFTSSCSLSLYDSAYDLSRRVQIVNMMPFSFREFVYFRKGVRLDPIGIGDFHDLGRSRALYGELIKYEALFEAYLKGGGYPFTEKERDPLPLFRNMLTTILNKDIYYAEGVSHEEQFQIERMLEFIGKSHAEEISYSSISSNLGITKYKSEKFVGIMEKAFVLNQVFPKGTNVKREPKILFSLPYRLLYRKFEDCIGALREDFFVEAARMLGLEISYLKSMRGEKTPDYIIDDTVFEIGGKGKGRRQFKGIGKKRKMILTQPGAIDEMKRPLFLFGMVIKE